VGKGPDFAIDSPSGIWVGNRQAGTLSRVNPTTMKVDKTVTVGGAPTGLAVDSDRLWIIAQVGETSGKLTLVDGPTAKVLTSFEVGPKPLGLITSPGQVWVTLHEKNQVVRVQVS
jgi:YVTN family beta-propeller protein